MAVSALTALVTTGTQWAVATTFGLAMAVKTFAISFALSAVSRALMPKPDLSSSTGLSTTVKSPTQPRPIIYGRTKTAGTLVYIQTTDTDGKYLHMVQAMAGHEIDAYEKIYIDDELAWENGTTVSKYASKVRFKVYKGDQTTADTDLVAESSEWNSNCVLNDTAYIYVRLEYDVELFPNGIPTISALMRGKKVYNPVTSVTEWSQNPALCIADYINDSKYGLSNIDIDQTALIASANVCDQQVDYQETGQPAGTHDRYQLNGYIDTSTKVSSNIENMLSAMFGEVVYSQGKLSINAGYYTNPVLDIDESMMVGDITLQTKQSRRSQYNAVKGVFLSSENDYVLADYPSQISSSYALEDGEPIYLDMTLPFTTDNYRAQRLAKLALGKSRQQRVITVPVNLVGLKLKAGDNIRITSDKLGLSNAVYQVLDYELDYSDGLKVNLVCAETSASLYDWALADQQDFSIASDVELYDGSALPPTNLNLTAGTTIKSDGTTATYIDVSWTAPADVYFDYYEVTITPSGGSATSFTTKEPTHTFVNTEDDLIHVVSVRAYNSYGRVSSAITAQVTTNIDTTAPSNITGITATGGLQSITLNWTNPSEDDFDLVRIKHNTTNTEPSSHSFEVRSDSFVHDIGAYSNTRYYWLAPVDRTGNVGNYVSGGSATTGSIAIGDVPAVAGTLYLTLGDNNAPTDVEFNNAVGRDPIEGDVAIVNKEYFFTRGASSWTAVTEFIDGSLLVSDSVTANEINTNTVLTESLLANTADITGDLTVTSGKITVQDTDTVINLDPDAQYPFRISQGTEDVVRLGSGTLDPFIKGAFIRGMPVQSINEADLTTFVRNVVGVTSEEKTETETLTQLPTGGNIVYLEADNITTGLTTVLTLETLEGTQSWLHQYEEASDWDSGDSIFFKYTMQGYNGSAWVDIPNWIDRYIYGSGYRVDGAIVGWSINESHSETIENNTYTHFRMVVQNMVSDFGGGEHPTSTGINCDFKLTVVTGSQVNSDNYVNSFSINDTSGVITVGRTGSLGDLTADISTYVSNQVSALVDSAPASLDTLNELASALGDDANFSTTVTNSIGTKTGRDSDETITGDWTFNGLVNGVTRVTSLPTYTFVHSDTPDDWDDGLSVNFVGASSSVGYPDYGSVMRIKTYDNDGGNGEVYFPYSSTYGGDQLQYRLGKYNNAGMTGWRKIWDDNQFSTTDVSNWNTAYSWGNHADAGYLTSASADTLDDVTDRGATTTNAVTVGSLTTGSGGNISTGAYANITSYGNVKATNGVFQIGNTTVIDSSRNLTNISDTQSHTKVHKYLGSTGDYIQYVVPLIQLNHTGASTESVFIGKLVAWRGNGLYTPPVIYINCQRKYNSTNYELTYRTEGHTTGFTPVTFVYNGNTYLGVKQAVSNAQTYGGFYVDGYTKGTVPTLEKIAYYDNRGTVLNAEINNSISTSVASTGSYKFGSSVSVAGTLSAQGYNNTNWDTAYGWGDHSTQGYLTSLPSHNHDDLYYTESEADSRFVNVTGDTMTGTLTVPNLTIGSGSKIKFANNDYIRYDDSTNRFHFDVDGGLSNGSVKASTFIGGLSGNASTSSKWTTARTLSLTGDVTGSTTWDGSGNASITATVANNSHTHDGRYYTESEVNTFINRSFVSGHSAGNLAVGWYTIATNTGDRASARFGIWDTNSGDHQSVTFYASHHFGTNSSNTLTVLDNSYYSGNPFRYIRIKDASTYDGAALQVYIDDSSNSVNAAILGDNFQSGGWVLCDWIPDATTPPNVSNYGNFGERSRVDLNSIAQGGFATTGEIYAGGDTSQYRVFHDAFHPNADKWTTARTLSLTGDVTGSVSWDGSANASLSVTVNNDSHNHDHSDGSFTTPRLYVGDGNDGYFYSDTNGRTAFRSGNFYIQSSVSNYYNYATNQYHGGSSGDNHYFRANTLNGNNWDIDSSGNISGRTFEISGSTVVDANRNITGIGTITTLSSATSDMFWLERNSTSGITSTLRNNTGGNTLRLYGDYANNGSLCELQIQAGQNGDYAQIGTWTNQSLYLKTNNTNRLEVQNNGYVKTYNGLQVFRNLGNQIGGWPDGEHTISLENSDAGWLSINFHRAGYTSDSLYCTGSSFNFTDNLNLTSGGYQINGTTVIDSARNADFATIETTGTNRFSGSYTYFGTTTSNRAEIVMNTANAGSPQITFTDNQGDMTWSIGGDDADNHFKLHGNYSSSIPIINNLSTPQFEWQNSGNFIVQGNITAYSDERLKGNIKTIDNALDKVSSLKGVTFDKIHEEEDIRHTGVIAQDVEKVLPEAVITHNTGYKSVAYGNMVGLLIEAIKELKSEIEELKNGNNTN